MAQPTFRVTPRRAEIPKSAWAFYEEGLRESNRSQDDAHARAIDLFEEALSIAPKFLEPMVALADCYFAQVNRGNLSPIEANRKGQQICDLALASDPRLARALALKGLFRGAIERSRDGLHLVERALDIDPGDALNLTYYALVLRGFGLHEKSVIAAQQAAELNPFLLPQIRTWTLFCAGREHEALASAREARDRRPYMDVTNAFVSVLAAWNGHFEEALEAGQSAAVISKRNPTMLCGLGYALARSGDEEAARALTAEISASNRPRAIRPHLAAIHAELGDRDSAIACLLEARSERCPYFLGSRYDPRLVHLQGDARFKALYD